jgi:hypothetical protein
MKKLALAAAAVATATTLTGAAVLPASGDSKVHTRHLVAIEKTSHRLGKFTFAGTDVDRHAGNVVGYDAISGHFYPRQNRVVIWFSVALKGGNMSGKVHSVNIGGGTPVKFAGRILNGTGRFHGARGTITAHSRSESSKKTFITLVWQS